MISANLIWQWFKATSRKHQELGLAGTKRCSSAAAGLLSHCQAGFFSLIPYNPANTPHTVIPTESSVVEMAKVVDVKHVPYPHTVSFAVFKKEKLAQREFQLSQKLRPTFPLSGRYRGTIKLHGTNATLIFRAGRTTPTYQSRNRVITLNDDNQGTVAHLPAAVVAPLVDKITRIHGSRGFTEIMVAGELCGEGIHHGVAVATMPRLFCIFGIRIDGAWVDMARYASVAAPQARVFNIMDYRTWEVKIDLDGNTGAVYRQMMAYTEEVGKQCPFGASFVDANGASVVGAGEGIVWTLIPEARHDASVNTELVSFKTKTDAFVTTSRRPKVPPTKAEADASGRAAQFLEYAVNERRLEQGVEYMREMKRPMEKANVGEFMKWVVEDTMREEVGAMIEMKADEKVVRKLVGRKASRFWVKMCDGGV